MSNELLIEVLRGGTVESRHYGAALVYDYRGNRLAGWGDGVQRVFPRSAIKPIQAIALVESGACDHFQLSEAQIALACASHLGEPMHVTLAGAWLQQLGLSEAHLACGPQMPRDEVSAQRLLEAGQPCNRLHNNCSGKHAGLLSVALHRQQPVADYHQRHHPVQQYWLDILSDLAQMEIRDCPAGIDGCGIPAPTLPLQQLALAMARFANPVALPAPRAAAIHRIQAAIAHEPLYLAGHGSPATALIEATAGAVLAKNGAEGIYVAALPERGLGIALKIADGAARAASVALLAILDHLGALSDAEKERLRDHLRPPIRNTQGLIVGEIRPAPSWLGG